jgi:Ras GTPase-activating-like protein IQGAP2/3
LNVYRYNKITLTISCEEIGCFDVEVSVLGVKVPGKFEIKLQDLLESQFNGVQVINLFDDLVKVNVNLLIFLINKK